MVGRHRDYVKALTWARHPSLLFSGALDRMLSVWDVSGQSNGTPIFSIDLGKIADYDGVGSDGERGSVYALGVGEYMCRFGRLPLMTDPAGKVLAAGTPERVVRLWDPRAGDQSVGKLVGHNDCVRSIVLSEDGRYVSDHSALDVHLLII
jgi:WD repeat-containing protein 48